MLDTLVLDPTVPHALTVIILHGLGAGASDFEGIAPMLGLPHARYVLPQAPDRAVTINGGYVMPAWYDILTLSWAGARESASDVKKSAVELAALVDVELDRGKPVVLAGFSQGAAMAFYVGLRHPRPLAGLAMLSGYPIGLDALAAEASPANAKTPAFVAHGRRDEVVPFAGGEALAQLLGAGGRAVTFRPYPIGHEVSGPEILDLGRFLKGLGSPG